MKKSIYFLSLIFLAACGASGENSDETTDQSETSTIINPPLEGDFQNDTIFKIDPTKATSVSTPNGSSIDIPANVLVDSDGNAVTSEVEVSFTQYHSTADILASGIPMTYDSSGTSGTFQSAGMFTLHAAAEGKEVFIKDGAAVDVNLASDTPEPYNYYNMDEQTGDWTYDFSPRTPVRSNPRFDPSKFPLEPQKVDENSFVLDFNLDLSDYDELSSFDGVVWEYVGDHDSLDPRENSVVQTTLWTDFDLEPTYEAGMEYYMTLIKGEVTFTTKVKAALQGEDFEAAMTAFQTRKKEIADEIDYLQKPYIRSVSIGGFGTYNYDIIHTMDNPIQLLADFEFDNKNDNDNKKNALVFTVFPDQNSVANYPEHDWDKFAVDLGMNMQILAVLPGNRIAYYDKSLKKCKGKTEFTFKMKVSDKTLDSKADLENFMANL